MTVATMTTAAIAAADKAEIEAQRIADHQQAAADLAAVELEWDAQVPPLESAAKSAKAKLDRAQKALDAAREAHDAAGRPVALLRLELSERRDRALRHIAASADPAWDAFVSELRESGAAALKSRFDSVTGNGSFGHQTVDRERVAHNARAKAFWQACQTTINTVRNRKQQPDADSSVEILKLRSALPTITANN